MNHDGRNPLELQSLLISRNATSDGNKTTQNTETSNGLSDGTERHRGGPSTNTEGSVSKSVAWRRIWYIAKPEIKWLALASLFLVVSAVSNLFVPTIIGNVIDGVIPDSRAQNGTEAIPISDLSAGVDIGIGNDKIGNFRMSITALLFVFALLGLTTSSHTYMLMIIGERVVLNLRRRLFESVMLQEIAMFDTTRTGELLSRLASDTTALQTTLTTDLSGFISSLIQVTGGIGWLFTRSVKLTLVLATVVPCVSVSAIFYGKYVKRIARRVQDAIAVATEVAEESISNVRTVRSFVQEVNQVGRYSEKALVSFQEAKKLAVARATFRGFMILAGSGALSVVLWFGGTLVIDGEITVGELTSYVIYALYIGFSFANLSRCLYAVLSALGASERVFELLERRPNIPHGVGRQPTQCGGVLEFQHVTFAYPSRPTQTVLADLSLSLRPGKVVALVGMSGGGKSTVAALMQRFYDSNRGRILLDGIDVRALDPLWLRNQIGVVSQEPVLFATSIRENIMFGSPHITPKDIDRAVKNAHLTDVIESLPEGLDTLVGERGIRLSGGQKQRVAIARALVKNPKILLLDEATSALDGESEHHVKMALQLLMSGRTVIIIAHRLSTVEGADEVLVLDSGQVLERGTHEELLSQKGAYATLVSRQLVRCLVSYLNSATSY